MVPQTFIFIGRSGSGKGTQANLLTERLRPTPVIYIEPGEHIRKFIQTDSLAARAAEEIMRQGERHPSFLPIWLWSDILLNKFTGNEVLIFDGAARALIEAEALDGALHFFKIKQPMVIFLDVSVETATQRLVDRGRVYDSEEENRKRFVWFERDVKPVIDYYRANQDYYRLLTIDGHKTIEEIQQAIAASL